MTTSHLPAQALKLHRFALSGHCHRVELLLSLLALPVDKIDVNLAAQEHKTPAFLAMNPFGQVPVLQDGALTVADSNAILIYLATQYGPDWLPQSPAEAAELQRWLTVAAGPLAFGPAMARLGSLFKAPVDVSAAQARAHALFAVLDAHLAAQDWLGGARVTLADIANYSYVARAPEGGVSLSDYPQIRAWLTRIEALPRFIPMP
ncbi:MAG TPA: glutathione S-transferase [Rhodocyclaceae bacterium]|nr:glutathione S-transferase [Rhodocyclaceae bacterium]